MKKKVIVLTLGLVLFGLSVVFAQEAVSSVNQSAPQPVDVGNKFCPVSGRPIGVMGPGVTQEYNGKIYHLCCGGCVSTFQSNPEKYSKIAESGAMQANKN